MEESEIAEGGEGDLEESEIQDPEEEEKKNANT